MNKQEKLIVLLLGLALAGWMYHSFTGQKKVAEARREAQKAAAEAAPAEAAEAANREPQAAVAVEAKVESKAPVVEGPVQPPTVHAAPERLVVLSNAQMSVTLTSYGAAVKSATLAEYATAPGPISEDNPPVTFDFSSSPALAVAGVPGLAADADYAIAERGADFICFTNSIIRRRITLKEGYRLVLEESLLQSGPDGRTAFARPNSISLGAMALGSSKNDILSIDSWLPNDKGGQAVHHAEDGPLKGLLSGSSGGCSGKRDATGIPAVNTVACEGGRTWIAVKNRFFVAALVSASEANIGFDAVLERDPSRADYALRRVGAAVKFAAVPGSRSAEFYIGPKKLSALWALGMRDVMEFGMWRWLCYPIVWLLNMFHSWIPSFGIGIILLTVLVRVLFWPLTHKSTVGMRKMQEIQPRIKEIQAKYKDNPQRLQQETWQCYRENKVNPMSSCLPMLVQIPVFIALFTVLRSTVELRYAPFLWMADLSEPENLWPSIFPFGGLNILPILMAVTMALQSALTPTAGDKAQQRMMMVMMPVMMLVMFYNFPSALSLYWTLSQVLSIVQMWWIRKKYGAPAAVPAVAADAATPPETRQMRRHQK